MVPDTTVVCTDSLWEHYHCPTQQYHRRRLGAPSPKSTQSMSIGRVVGFT